EPESNSPNKNHPTHTRARKNPNQKNPKPTKNTKTGISQKTVTPLNGKKRHNQKNNKQKPPNTLLSSQTTHPPGRATNPRHNAAI
ncbi:MAG: hypothetical protein ACPGXI_03955, partial [Mycobacterium sp.]